MLSAEVIDGFTIGLLASKYDNPKPIPKFHKEMWELACSDKPKVAVAAPRGHAKSTAMTYAYVMAMMLFRQKSFCLLVSDTEGQAAEFLGDIKAELNSNEALRKTFGIKRLIKDTETNVIAIFNDGEKFRIIAKGSEQKVRGLKWGGKRPDLIVCHAEGTPIYDFELGWMKVEDHPTATPWDAECIRVSLLNIENDEITSEDHPYWVKRGNSIGWVRAKDLRIGDCIGDTREDASEPGSYQEFKGSGIGDDGRSFELQDGVWPQQSSTPPGWGEFLEEQHPLAGHAIVWRPIVNIQPVGRKRVVAVRTKAGFYKTAFGMSHNCDDL